MQAPSNDWATVYTCQEGFSGLPLFASSLVSKRSELTNLQCFGTDGEAALVNAFSIVFIKALHLRFFLHFQQNVEYKLQEFGVSLAIIKEVRKNIFGDPQQLELGLVDINS